MADDQKITMELDLENGTFTTKMGDAVKQVQNFEQKSRGHFSAAGAAAIEFNQALELMKKAVEAVSMAFDFMGEAIAKAAEEQAAIHSLNQSLSVTGQYSKETSEHFQALADSIEKTTSISEGAIYSAEALATRYTKTAAETEKLTKAAVELSAATGQSLDTAIMQLGMTTQGAVGRLGKMVPALKQLTEGELENGKAIDFVLSKYAGSSANTITTFEGRVSNLKNSFENFMETLGGIVVKSPIVNAAIEKISGFIRDLTDKLDKFMNAEKFDQMIKSMSSFAAEWGKYVIAPLELAWNVGEVFFAAVKVGFQAIIVLASEIERALYEGIIAPFLKGAETVANVMAKLFPEKGGAAVEYLKGLNQQLNEETRNIADGSKEILGEMAGDLANKIDGVYDFSFTDKFDKGLQDFDHFVQSATQKQAKFIEQTNQIGEAAISVSGAFSRMYAGIDTEANNLVKNAGKNFENLGKTILNSVGQGTAQAFAAFGSAVATGKNALQAFANSLLSTMGSMAVQLGTQFILQGTAYMWAGMPNGGALISAGAALATFGGMLSGLGGSKGGGGGAESSVGSSSLDTKKETKPTAESPDMASETQMKAKQMQIVVNGDWLDTREGANHLSEIIRKNSDITDYTITAQGRSYA